VRSIARKVISQVMASLKVHAEWEEWQRRYAHGAFYIFPPESVGRPVDELRSRYDARSAKYSSAHISLSEPLAAPLSESQREEIVHELACIEPFEVHYGPLRNFAPYPGVAYTITPETSFVALRNALHATSAFLDVDLNSESVPAHMTVAEFITLERSKELLDELSEKVSEGSFWCDEIVYAVPNDAFKFQRVLSLPLKRER